MPLTASRSFAIGLFACIYGVAKWSDSSEVRYIAMILSIMLLLITLGMKYWRKRQRKLASLSSDPLGLPGPKASNSNSGNLRELIKCGSINEYIIRLSHIYGPIGSFFWGNIKIAYIASDSILSDKENKKLLQTLQNKPISLYSGLKPLIGINNIQFTNDSSIYNDKITKIFHKMYGKENLLKSLMTNYSKLIQENISNVWMEKLRKSKESEVKIDIETDLFSFCTKFVLESIFGDLNNKDDDVIIAQIMENYNECLNEIEQRLINGSPPNQHRKQKYEKCMKNLKHGIQTLIDKQISSSLFQQKQSLLKLFKENENLYPDNQSILDEIISTINVIHKIYYGLLWICYFIGKHNKIQNKMIDEIGSIFVDDKEEKEENKEKEIIPFDDEYLNKLKKLKFCRNVIKESLRITSIVSWTSRVCPDGDLILNAKNKQVKIPKDTPIIICLGAINTEKQKWDNNPFVFNPQRFDNNIDNVDLNIFGGLGNRSCPGKLLFETQTLLFMLNILNKFKLIWKESEDVNIDTIPIRPKYQLLTKPNKKISLTICKRKFAML